MSECSLEENLSGCACATCQREYRELVERAEKAETERDHALQKAAAYERDWYEAKCEFGDAMRKLRDRLRGQEERAEKAAEELRQIKTYLGHYDQDANHAWMVRRIDAVLDGRDPGSVDGWTEHDAVPRRTAFKDAVERAEKAEAKVAELEDAIRSYMRKDIGNELINLRERAEKAEAIVRELEAAIDQHVQSYQFDKERLEAYAKANPPPQTWFDEPDEETAQAHEPKANTIRCWRCKRDVPEDTTVCLPGVGTQCKDSSACRLAR